MKPAHLTIVWFVFPEEGLRTRIGRDIPQLHIVDHDPLGRLQEGSRGDRKTRTWPRVQAILLAKQGATAPPLARALGFSRRTVQAWVTSDNRGGLEWRRGRTAPTPAAHRPCPTTGRVPSWSRSTPRRAPRTGPGSGAAPTSAHPGRRIEVWHQDEARFGQQGTLTRVGSGRVGARRGSRPRRVRQDGRESLDVLTAVCAASGAAAGLVLPERDTAVVHLFLEELSGRLAPAVPAVLRWDNAGDHTAGGRVVPERRT
jgi:putative transposase